MDIRLKLRSFKVKNRRKYLNPADLKKLFPDPTMRGKARRVWRGDNTLCNPLRVQFKH